MTRSTVRSSAVRPTSFHPAIERLLTQSTRVDAAPRYPRLQGRAPGRRRAAVQGSSPALTMSLPTRRP